MRGYTRQEKKGTDQFNLEGKLQQEHLPHSFFFFFFKKLVCIKDIHHQYVTIIIQGTTPAPLQIYIGGLFILLKHYRNLFLCFINYL